MKTARILLLMGALFGWIAQAAEPAVVVAAVDRAPLAYVENGKLAGLLYELSVEAFRRIGRPLDFRLMPWPRCVAETRSGDIDATLTVFRTPERKYPNP